MEVKLDTMRRWLRIAAKHSEQVNAVLLKGLKVSQVELDALWSFVKKTIFAAGRTSGGRSLERSLPWLSLWWPIPKHCSATRSCPYGSAMGWRRMVLPFLVAIISLKSTPNRERGAGL